MTRALLGTLLAGTLALAADDPARGPLAAGAERAALQRIEGNTPYDGRFTFVRLRFTPNGQGMGYTPPWAHDYPKAERNLMRIVGDLTLLAPRIDGGNVLRLDDPELFKYPLAYICEPGFWSQTDQEAEALRAWLLKGGFLIVDDFRGSDINNFQAEMRRVLPGAELVDLDLSHPVFRSFFAVESLDVSAPTFRRYKPAFFGIYEDNDPAKRLLAVVNYNNDIGDLWEYSDVGWMPVEVSNAAYKLGVNYIMYAMTH